MLSPILSGFGVTPEVPAGDLARMLTIVEAHIGELAHIDPSYAQLARDLVGMQRRGIASSPQSFGIHAGLAEFLRARNAWDASWDAQVVGR